MHVIGLEWAINVHLPVTLVLEVVGLVVVGGGAVGFSPGSEKKAPHCVKFSQTLSDESEGRNVQGILKSDNSQFSSDFGYWKCSSSNWNFVNK